MAPDHSDALNNLGTLYLQEGQLERAEEYFQRVSRHLLFKKQFVTYHNLSKIAARKGDIPLSRKYNRQALEELDRYCPALFHRGLLFYRERKWEQANKILPAGHQGNVL